MKRILTAVVLIPLVLLVVFKAPLWLFSLIVGLVVVLSLHEYLGIVEHSGIEPVRWIAYALAIFIVVHSFIFVAARYQGAGRYALYEFAIQAFYLAIPVLISLLFGIPVIFRRELRTALAASATSAFSVFYIAIPLAILISMRLTSGARSLIVFVLFSVWAGDIAAYYVGKKFGRHKLAPVVSPNKTWEGAIASLVASVIVAWLVFHFREPIDRLFIPPRTFYTPLSPQVAPVHMVHVIVLGIITNVAAQFGDLFESAIKRGAQLKDSGSLLPGHGGILDRIDALLFAIPVVWYYAEQTQFLYP
jgi:phosphatidate cytidylyltransferase